MTQAKRARVTFALIFVAHALGAMSLLSVLTAGPQLVAALGLSALQIGALASVYSASLAAVSLPAGLVTDRLGTRAALTLAAMTIAAGLAVCANATGFAQMGTGIALCGAGYGLINPAAGRAITLWFTPRWRTTLLSVKQTGVPTGAALGSLTAVLGATIGWQAGILSAAAIALTAGGLFLVLLPADTVPAAAQAPVLGRLCDVLRLPGLGRANLAAGLTNGMQFALWAHLPGLIERLYATDSPALGLCLAALHVGTFAGRLVWGALTDRIWQGNAARALTWLCLTGLGGVAAFGASALAGHLWLAVLGCVLLGFTICAAVGLHVALTAHIAPEPLLGGAMGYTMLVTNLGGVGVPVVLGLAVVHAGIGGAVLTLAVMLALTVALLPRQG